MEFLDELKELHKKADEINKKIDIPNMDEEQESYVIHIAIIVFAMVAYLCIGLLR
jgi:hypothetical protein